MSFPRYPAYKDSGVEWLGEIPADWHGAPLLAVASERCESNADLAEDNLLSLSYGRIIQKDIASNDGLLPESFETYQVIHPGDIVLRLTDLQNDKRSLRSALVGDCGIITSAYLCVRPTGAKSEYLAHLLRAYDVRKIFYSMGGGLRQSMKFADLRRMPVLLPSPEEQTAIASFLDRETGKIDALVAEQEKLIALLKEKRQAVISHAVTKGLNPDAPMKPSGIEWLGDVPAHWDMKRLGLICSDINDINHEMPSATEYGVPFLSAKDLLDDGTLNFTLDIKLISEEDFEKLSRKICPRRGDIIYSRIGARLGKARLVENDQRFLVSYSCCVIRVLDSIAANRFIQRVLDGEMMLIEARMRTQGIGVPDLGLGEIGRFSIPLPSLDEQLLIADFLDDELIKFDVLITEAKRAVSLLCERRSALISAAVTGQIDVRGLSKAAA